MEENFKKQLEERLAKVEVVLETLKTGQAVMCDAMVRHGLLSANGEVVETPRRSTADASHVDVEKLIGELKAERKDTRSAKAPYFLAEQKKNQNDAFRVLQEKVRAHGGFWSKKVDQTLYKFWFSYGDETKLCYRKEG